MFNTKPLNFTGMAEDGLAIFREADDETLRAERCGGEIILYDDDGETADFVQKIGLDDEAGL